MASTTLMTAEELAELEPDGNRYELIRGELTSMAPAGGRHGEIAFAVAVAIGVFLREHPIGKGYDADTGFIISRNPDTVLAPDVAFVHMDRLPPDEEREGFLRLAPDLAVEVISPSERAGHLNEKVIEYLDAGVRMLWLIEPRRRTVTVYSRDRTARLLAADDVLDGGDVLPGFSVPVSELFR